MGRIGKDTFALLKNAEYNGIIDILPPRYDASRKQKGEVRGQLPRSLLRDALEKSKKAKIFTITGGGYLSSIAEGGFYELFKKPALNYPDYEVQMLLNIGYGAKIRGKREHHQEDYILNRVKSSREKVKEHPLVPGKEIIKLKYYNFIPQAGFVITDDKMFFDPYHMADHTYLKTRWKEQFPDVFTWCGGRVPIFVAKKDSTLYDAIENYFDWLWKHEDPEIFNGKFKKYFNVEDDVATEEE